MKPGSLSVLFALKLFIAAMIAFTISVSIGLPQPYWSLVTCCVVMAPMTGAVRSKAVYRFAGTFGGGVAALLLAALFASIPLLLIVGAGLVATLAFACSMLDRTPRGYGFGLFGITLMLVAVAGADHPEAMFDTATARVLEICIGILAATFVDSVIVPRSLGPTLRRRLRGWLPDIETWMNDAFGGRIADAQAEHDRLTIIADITALSALTGQLRYDPMVSRDDLQCALAIQQRLLRLTPILSAIASRIAGAAAAERAATAPLLEEASLRRGRGDDEQTDLIARLRHLPVIAGEDADWHRLVRDTLADLVADALRLWGEVRRIDAALHGEQALAPDLHRSVQGAAAFPLPPDWNLSLRIAGGILAAYAILCSLWWATGWHQGAGAVLLGTVGLAFFGGSDNPGPIIAKFGQFTAIAFVAAGILAYGLLPLAHDYPTFAFALALYMLPLGIWAASNPFALLLLAIGLSSINLQAQYSPLDFGVYIESMLGNLAGIYVAFACAHLFRTLGPAHAFARLARKECEDIARLSWQASGRARDAYIHRALDRIGAMTLRFRGAGTGEQSVHLLGRLRAGVNVAELRMASANLCGEARRTAEALLAQIRREIGSGGLSPQALGLLDHALSAAWRGEPHPQRHDLLRALAGLRLAFFGSAPAWVPAP